MEGREIKFKDKAFGEEQWSDLTKSIKGCSKRLGFTFLNNLEAIAPYLLNRLYKLKS